MRITPESVFNMRRRDVLKLLGLSAAAALLPFPAAAEDAAVTSEEAATKYNNFYEFGFSKGAPARNARNFTTEGWTVRVGGLVGNPLTLSVPDMLARFGEQERVFRMRCVEGWSMVIPWRGFELNKLLALAQPDPKAAFVAFEAAADPGQMPEVKKGSFPFPYREGLRLDEALHPLAILATGAYGKPLRPQSGAPIRLVVPWKYGFKSVKSIVSITLTEQQPPTTWDVYNPREYGFYANVNPNVPHPRWSQATERRIGPGGLSDIARQDTVLYNGYREVAPLYAGLDLAKNY